MIADQIPTKLAADTVKNTNLKIVHRTLAAEDRECIGLAMHMSPEQIDYLSSLHRGCAAVYSEGDNRPKLVKMPLIKADEEPNRQELLKTLRKRIEVRFADYYQTGQQTQITCIYCENRKCPSIEMRQCMNSFGVGQCAEVLRDKGLSWGVMRGLVHVFEKNIDLPELNPVQTLCLVGFWMKQMRVIDHIQAQIIVQGIKELYPERGDGSP